MVDFFRRIVQPAAMGNLGKCGRASEKWLLSCLCNCWLVILCEHSFYICTHVPSLNHSKIFSMINCQRGQCVFRLLLLFSPLVHFHAVIHDSFTNRSFLTGSKQTCKLHSNRTKRCMRDDQTLSFPQLVGKESG